MGNYDSIDLRWDWAGDLRTDSSGDIADTSDDYLRAFDQKVFEILTMEIGDNRSHSNLGASLKDYIGRSNSKETGKEIEQRARTAILSGLNLPPRDMYVRVVPVAIDSVVLVVFTKVEPTADNRLRNGETHSMAISYSLGEGSISTYDVSLLALEA